MKKKRGPASKFRHLAEYALFQIISFFVSFLSLRGVYGLGQLLGRIPYHLRGKRYRIALANLHIAYGDEKSPAEKKYVIKDSFSRLAVSALQCLWLKRHPETRIRELFAKEPRGLDLLKECLGRGKGVFFLTAHYGNWEALGIYHGILGMAHLDSIVRRLDNPYLEKAAREFRAVSGNGIFYREESPLKIARALKNNTCVAVMMDQNTARGGVFVEFFGKKAATPRSVALLSYRLGTPILPLFAHPGPMGTYTLEYGPELKLEKTGNKVTDILNWTQECEKFIESVIRKHPEPWMWGHRRWKTRPPDEKNEKIYP
ncbi:MAG: lysophospholipid acyltransferase family protein [Nitrospinaceae bacterium]